MNKEDKKVLKLISPISPSVNHYMAYRTIMKNGKPMAMSYKTADSVKYQKEFELYVKQQVKDQGWKMSENKYQHYYMDTIFYFPRIDMDANNYFKCLADSITSSECVWIDDTQLCERVQRIYYDNKNPRIELTIIPVDYVGIFDNQEELDLFENNCKTCKKYKDGKCSLLVKSKECRIQEEISEDKICSKYSEIKSK